MLVTYQNNNIYYQITNYYKQYEAKLLFLDSPRVYKLYGEHFDMHSNFGPSSIAGHLGSVNDVDFHRVEPIILSASSDKQIYLGEFDDE